MEEIEEEYVLCMTANSSAHPFQFSNKLEESKYFTPLHNIQDNSSDA